MTEQGPRQVVECFYEDVGKGPLEDILGLFDPQVEWHWPPGMVESRVFRGHDDMLRGMREFLGAWGDFHFVPEEWHEERDWVLVLVRYVALGRASGIPIDELVPHLWEVRDGLVKRVFILADAEKARRRFLAGDRPA
jgi:ketosteroid isomerase-like protein